MILCNKGIFSDLAKINSLYVHNSFSLYGNYCLLSGTICIEAALIGHNIAPGFNREFACEAWDWFSEEIFEQVRTEADEQADYDCELDVNRMIIDLSNSATQAK